MSEGITVRFPKKLLEAVCQEDATQFTKSASVIRQAVACYLRVTPEHVEKGDRHNASK